MTDNAALVEIKKSTQLLSKRPYREGVYGVHSEIGKSVTQGATSHFEDISFKANQRVLRSSVWRQVCKEAGLEWVTPNAFRRNSGPSM
jgi:hypothetical protein